MVPDKEGGREGALSWLCHTRQLGFRVKNLVMDRRAICGERIKNADRSPSRLAPHRCIMVETDAVACLLC